MTPLNFTNQEKIFKKEPKEKTAFKGKYIYPFWEELSLKDKAPKAIILTSTNEGYTSMLNNEKKSWLEGKKHVGFHLENGQEKYPWVVCSQGTDERNKQPCVGCAYQVKIAPQCRKEKKQNIWNPKIFAAFNVIHLDWYRKEIRVDAEGNPVTFNDIPQYNTVKCNYSDENAYYGHLLKLVLSNNHYKTLTLEIAKDLFWTCDGCGTGLTTKRVYCPSCNANLLEESNLNRDNVAYWMLNQFFCSCDYQGYPKEDLECGYDPEGQTKKKRKYPCPYEKPERMDLFNCVLVIKKTGEQTSSKIELVEAYSFNPDSDIAWTPPTDKQDNILFDGNAEHVIKSVVERREGKLYDLEKDFSPLSIELQAQILKVENPFEKKDIPEQPNIQQKPSATKLNNLILPSN